MAAIMVADTPVKKPEMSNHMNWDWVNSYFSFGLVGFIFLSLPRRLRITLSEAIG